MLGTISLAAGASFETKTFSTPHIIFGALNESPGIILRNVRSMTE